MYTVMVSYTFFVHHTENESAKRSGRAISRRCRELVFTLCRLCLFLHCTLHIEQLFSIRWNSDQHCCYYISFKNKVNLCVPWSGVRYQCCASYVIRGPCHFGVLSPAGAEGPATLLGPGVGAFWTEHSERNGLPTWAASCGAHRDHTDRLGRWGVGRASSTCGLPC